MDIENINSNIGNPAMEDDDHIEQLLSEKLMEGYVLLDKSCPVCSTPLVKSNAEDEDEGVLHKEVEVVMIPKGSFIQPFIPVEGVPLCVACTSHVVTQENEVAILAKSGSLKAKGGFLMAASPSKKEPDIIDVTHYEETLEEPAYLDEKKEEEDFVDETMVEYSVRREIATKVLGAKMLQGYSLLDKQCEKCGMPTMEYMGQADCVVCPALVKKAKKLFKAQKKLEKESTRLEAHISMAKANMQGKDLLAPPGEAEIAARQLETLRENEAEEASKLLLLGQERDRMSTMMAEQARVVLEARYRQEIEAQRLAELAAEKARNAKEEKMKFEKMRKTMSFEQEHKLAQEKSKEVESKIAEDAKRLEEMELRRQAGLPTALESMNRDVLVAENRRRLEAKAALDLQIARLEESIQDEEIENKTLYTAKRCEDDERMISLLEQDAAEKARIAEEAIRRAKAALEHVHSARREIIAQTIAMAEKEVIAETEEVIKKDREDYKAPVRLPSASEIAREQWETLRTEGRAIMTRRVMSGWVLLAEFCKGAECHNSPLVTKDGKKECVVCGGCGNGQDGVYITVDDYEIVPTNEALQAMRESGVNTVYELTPSPFTKPTSPTANHTASEIQEDFETKRNMVSKEIGKRMIEGWSLLDASCPNCVMPLMMDTMGNTDVCVLCGIVDTMKQTDGMTIKTYDVPTKTVPVPYQAPIDLVKPMDAMTMASQAQTKTYTDDAETMYTTIGSLKEEISLVDSIRHHSQRQQKVTQRNDPPSSVYNTDREEKALDPDQIGASSDTKGSEQEISASTLSAMIMNNTSGRELAPSMTTEEVKNLVQTFAEKNLDISVSETLKSQVAEGIEDMMSGEDGIIHLEDTTSPRAFNFDTVESDDYFAGRQPQTPDSSSRVRATRKGMPPRPDSAPRSPPRRQLRTPTASSPRHGGYYVTGGPSDVTSLGDMSRAESVASDALDTILDRIDAAKATLLRDDVTVKEQLEAASLIEKLAQAAVAVKALEKIDR